MDIVLKFLMILILMTHTSLMADEVRTILALGDSITQGGKSFVSYRQVLVPALRERGLSFKFIGPKKDASSAHAGYGGMRTRDLRAKAEKLYRQFPADIVLIHSGHNSFSKDRPVPGIIQDTEAIIEVLKKINPEVKILLAQVIPAGKLPKYAYIPELNQALAVLADRLLKKGIHLTLVNQADSFDWRLDTVKDKVHPNHKGARKMAEKWMAALLPLLEEGEMETK